MLRDNLVGLIEPMLSSAGANPLAQCTARKKPSDDRPSCLENPRPEGAESTLTENAASPFHAEPRHCFERTLRRVMSQNMQTITTLAPSAQVFSSTYLDLHLQGGSSSAVPPARWASR